MLVAMITKAPKCVSDDENEKEEREGVRVVCDRGFGG